MSSALPPAPRALPALSTVQTGCAVTLLTSDPTCVAQSTYGCFAGLRKMWVAASCRGRFRCDGFELPCGRPRERRGRHNCSCYEYEAVQSDGRMAAGLVPEELARARLVEGSIWEHRFVPRTAEEVLTATLAFWNVLDRTMATHSKSNWQTGYMREVQLRRMVQLASSPRVKTYCEIGMNGAHSAVAMLHANPSLQVSPPSI